MPANRRLPYVLTGYGLPYSLGYIPLADGSANPAPWSLLHLMDRAVELNLAGVEAPLSTRVPSFDGKIVDVRSSQIDLSQALDQRGLSVVADSGVIVEGSVEQLADTLKMAHQSGAKIVRAIISNLLCGDRRPIEGGWTPRLDQTAQRLLKVLPLAEELGMVIALENHQDATAEDLLKLHDLVKQSPAFGITLDTGNPLAVGQDPVETCRRIAHLIRHVHLKDYTIHFAPEGYRLVRCVAGEGVIDFPAILEIVRANGHDVIPGIESAAQATRTVPLLDPGWWSTYPPRSSIDLLKPLQILWTQGRPAAEPYSSPWEQGADGPTIMQDEWDVVVRSVDYFRRLSVST